MNDKKAALTDYAGTVIAVLLTLCFGGGYLIGLFRPAAGANAIDGQMLKEVLLFVLGTVLGAAAVKKGVDQGATAALTPPPAPPTTGGA